MSAALPSYFLSKGIGVLILTRKKNERVFIGNGICVTVVEVRGDKVRLGIDAPEDVEIHREEVWLEIKAEGEVSDAGLLPAAAAVSE